MWYHRRWPLVRVSVALPARSPVLVVLRLVKWFKSEPALCRLVLPTPRRGIHGVPDAAQVSRDLGIALHAAAAVI